MTVGIIGHYLEAKMGIGTYLDRLLEPLVAELASRDIDSKVVASPNSFEKTPAIQRIHQKVPGQVVVLPALDYSPIKRFGWVSAKFASYCKQQGIDRVIWMSNPMVVPWHPPSMVVLHDVNEWKDKEKYGSTLKTTLRSWIYLEASIAWAEQIICVSDATKADLRHFKPGSTDKVKSISNGLDSPLVSIEPAEIEVPDAPFLLSVGRIDPDGKRLPEAVALTAALREVSNEPWELHLAGGMNKSTQQAGETFLRSIENKPWVHYQGYTEDAALAAWYRHATAVVFLSQNEGFGSPVAEAASFGRRVVVNANNPASFGAGGDAVIPVQPEDAKGSAIAVLETLRTEENSAEEGSATPPKVYTYADAAELYAAELANWIG